MNMHRAFPEVEGARTFLSLPHFQKQRSMHMHTPDVKNKRAVGL